MSNSYLIDTNILIAFAANDPAIVSRMSSVQFYVPVIVLGELYLGAQKSTRVLENLNRIDSYAARMAVLNCDLQTAKQYGEVWIGLRKKGRPIPDNDAWIASLALQHGLTLVSRDAHFNEVDDLTIESW